MGVGWLQSVTPTELPAVLQWSGLKIERGLDTWEWGVVDEGWLWGEGGDSV